MLQMTSFLLIAFAKSQFQAVLGVICTSIALGLGEVTLLSTSAEYNKWVSEIPRDTRNEIKEFIISIGRRVIKAWSSGTGGAGIFGSLSYASLIALGIPPQYTLLLFLVMPVIEATTFWLVLPSPKWKYQLPTVATMELDQNLNVKNSLGTTQYGTEPKTESKHQRNVFVESLKRKMRLLPSVVTFMLPLMIVFVCEYVIISGLVKNTHYFCRYDFHSTPFNQYIHSVSIYSWKWFTFAILS